MYKKKLVFFPLLFFIWILTIPLLASGDKDQLYNEAEYVMVVQIGKPGHLVGVVIYEDE